MLIEESYLERIENALADAGVVDPVVAAAIVGGVGVAITSTGRVATGWRVDLHEPGRVQRLSNTCHGHEPQCHGPHWWALGIDGAGVLERFTQAVQAEAEAQAWKHGKLRLGPAPDPSRGGKKSEKS
jgi:hypothetical protein